MPPQQNKQRKTNMALGKIKIKIKTPTPTAAERFHAQQQKNRKAAGLPDPSEYKKKLDSMKSEEVELDEAKKMEYDQKKVNHLKYVVGILEKEKKEFSRLKDSKEVMDIIDKAINMFAKEYTKHLNALSAGRGQDTNFRVIEEVEQLDEISPQLKASYVAGAKKQIKQSMPFTKKTDEYRDIAKNFIAKRQKGIAKANEEVEQLDEMPESNMKTKDVHSHLKKAGWALARSKGGHDVYKHPKAKHSIPVPRHNQLKAPLIRGIMKASKVEEQLEKKGRFVSGPIKQPYKSNTIVTAVKEATDEREYDYEGDMAKSDLRSIIHNAQTLHDMLDDNTNLAEWCQSKITLAEDYISTVTNYMRSEMNEEVKKNEYHISGKHKFPTKDEHAVTVKHTESGREHVHSGKGKYLSKLIKTRYNINHHFEEVEHNDVELDEMVVVKTNKPIGTRVADIGPGGKEYNVKTNKAWDDSKKKQPQGADFAAQRRKERLAKSGRMDEKENLPGLWANIHAKRKRGEPPAKPGDKDYPKTLNIESAAEPTEGEMKGKQGYSRKAQIVMNAAKSKKSDSPDKFQKDPELSSEIHKT